MFKKDMMPAYVSPSVVEIEISNEGVLCASGGTESLGTDQGVDWDE